ncbi:carbohydrate-binding protein [Streptomyces sp. CRN 30]|uniref:carbohydrate-binding protein n=1 Tax=Streptomyces sp. CRN 30 TaxID=3075613 RepID=UPI002A810AE6|nr:carbohydrate-binding protein [Streptomyces sp. CRN 30]
MVHRHAVAGRRAALTVLGALALSGLPPAVAADPPPTPARVPSAAQTLGADRPSPEVLRALQRDLGLTPSQAAARLVNEAEAGTRAGRLHNTLGPRFAGAWLGGTTSAELTVATTDAADVAAIEAQGAKAAVVRKALRELKAVKSKLDASAARVSTLDTPVWYVDVPANRVMVQATNRPAAEAFLKAAGVAVQDVGIRVSATRPRALADLRGGDGYYIADSVRCSVGFSVMSAATQKQGFVSAGHCGKAGDKTTGYDKSELGAFEGSVFPGADMSWVGVTSSWTATPQVKGLGNEMVQVAGSAQSLVGASVCRSGSTTGWHCGAVEQHGVSVSYGQGTVNGLSQTTVCAEPGDSGGSFISGTQAQGVTSGGSGDCTSGGTTYYQPVNPILQQYTLTLKTATGSAETPGPQDSGAADSWATSRVYEVGSTVTYGGVRYQCLQDHQAQGAWAPASTPALWQRL